MLAVHSETYPAAVPAREEEKRLEREVREVAREEQAAGDALVVLAEKNAVLEAYRAHLKRLFSRAAVSPDAKPAEWKAALEFCSAGERDATAKAREAERKRFEIRKRRQALEGRLSEIRSPEALSAARVILAVDAGAAGRHEASLRYAVPGASWSPCYESRLSTRTRAVELSAAVLVRQETGEDWTNVRLAVSTRRPEASLRPPDLSPLTLESREIPKPPAVALAARDATDEEEALEGEDGEEAPARPSGPAIAPTVSPARAAPSGPPAAPSAPVARPGEASLEWAVPGRVSLRSGPESHALPVRGWSLPAELSVECVPLERPIAFRRADLRNGTGVALPTGPADLFLDGRFIGRTTMERVGPGEAFALAFGAAEGISVVRRTTPVRFDRLGRRHVIEERFFLSNEGSGGLLVRVLASVPVSDTDAVKIALSKETTPDRRDVRPGVLEWLVPLRPGAPVEIRLGYTVEAAKGYKF